MYRNERNLLLFSHQPVTDEQLNTILSFTESPVQFCTAHELVDRNHITSNPRKVWKENLLARKRAFRFLINKN